MPFSGETQKELLAEIKKAEVKFEHPVWMTVSDPAKDLIKQMLCKDPFKRIKMHEILQDSWFDLPGSQAVDASVVSALKSYRVNSKLQ